jgi:steroid delta-isomerase-like uncharacterized protein
MGRDLIRRWLAFAEAGFDGDFDTYIDPGYVGHLSSGTTMDRAELERLERAFAQSFGDTRHVIHDLLEDGEKVVLRVESHATHRGEFYGIPATGRTVRYTGIVIYRIHDGRIAESWAEIDFASLIRQLRA